MIAPRISKGGRMTKRCKTGKHLFKRKTLEWVCKRCGYKEVTALLYKQGVINESNR
jgi:uncharacterized Zn finger protein (UPF0148 family)